MCRQVGTRQAERPKGACMTASNFTCPGRPKDLSLCLSGPLCVAVLAHVSLHSKYIQMRICFMRFKES